jgi:hypothetical protein
LTTSIGAKAKLVTSAANVIRNNILKRTIVRTPSNHSRTKEVLLERARTVFLTFTKKRLQRETPKDDKFLKDPAKVVNKSEMGRMIGVHLSSFI